MRAHFYVMYAYGTVCDKTIAHCIIFSVFRIISERYISAKKEEKSFDYTQIWFYTERLVLYEVVDNDLEK